MGIRRSGQPVRHPGRPQPYPLLPTDVYASTPTLSFATAHYSGKYLAFVPVEWFGEAADPSTPFGHAYLQQPTAQQQALLARYGGGSIPFVDIGNRYLLPQVHYVPSVLAELSWTQVAAAMGDPSSPVATAIDGAANVITAAICTLTHGQPAASAVPPGEGGGGFAVRSRRRGHRGRPGGSLAGSIPETMYNKPW